MSNQQKEVVGGYEIMEATTFSNGRGIAYAENPKAVQPFVTWMYTEQNGKRDCEWGHYFEDKNRAQRDYHTRITEYQTQYGVAARSVFPDMPLYNYFSTQRPVDIGTFPKTANGPLSFVNFDERMTVEDGAFRAWGILTYSAPLTEKQVDDYELRPAKDNPDREPPPLSIADQLKQGAAQAARDNAARPAPDKKTEIDR